MKSALWKMPVSLFENIDNLLKIKSGNIMRDINDRHFRESGHYSSFDTR